MRRPRCISTRFFLKRGWFSNTLKKQPTIHTQRNIKIYAAQIHGTNFFSRSIELSLYLWLKLKAPGPLTGLVLALTPFSPLFLELKEKPPNKSGCFRPHLNNVPYKKNLTGSVFRQSNFIWPHYTIRNPHWECILRT